ncbi:MAG: radical SAM protein [Thermoplasmata archaeon]|nr:MAG: radical SAM protein [Thermoplasmata archaeon]
MSYTKTTDSNKDEVVFIVDRIIEVRIPNRVYQRYAGRYDDREIISFCTRKDIFNAVTGRRLYYISEESGIPLIGHTAFGIIDRGTNLLQVRPSSGCNLNCIFCSVDEGKGKTKVTDYMVDVDYISKKFEEVSDFKRRHCNAPIEAHIDGQGEPFLYPYIRKLIEKLQDTADIISIQTNGVMLTRDLVKRLDGYVDRINLSLHSMDSSTAKRLSGIPSYDLDHVLEIAEAIAESSIDLLIAPVWVPGYNDKDMKKIIEFGKRIGAGKIWKPFGIQKYVKYKFGRAPKNVRIMNFKTFYRKLEEMGEGLHLYPEDFGMVKCASIPKKFKVGERVKLKIEMHGRVRNEMIAVSRDRIVQVVDTSKKVGETVNARIVRNKQNIYVARET